MKNKAFLWWELIFHIIALSPCGGGGGGGEDGGSTLREGHIF